MKRNTLGLSALVSALLLPAGFALAASQVPAKEMAQPPNQMHVYGSELMTHQERLEYRARMHSAKSSEELEKIRKEHHEQMQKRAKARGVTLPDEPPARGGAKGPAGGGR